jgi:hypothetical protein
MTATRLDQIDAVFEQSITAISETLGEPVSTRRPRMA